MKLEQVLVVLLLQQHDAIFEQNRVQVNGLDPAGVTELPGQRAVVQQPVSGQVQVLEAGGDKATLIRNTKFSQHLTRGTEQI